MSRPSKQSPQLIEQFYKIMKPTRLKDIESILLNLRFDDLYNEKSLYLGLAGTSPVKSTCKPSQHSLSEIVVVFEEDETIFCDNQRTKYLLVFRIAKRMGCLQMKSTFKSRRL